MNRTANPAGPDLAAQVVRALSLYAIAEFQSGHATALRITAEGNLFSVSDDGRGHAIDRTISGAPYLAFIYTQLDYPFGSQDAGPVQLQGIGMSLLNALCSELLVTVTKTDRTLRLLYRAGRLCDEAFIEVASQVTGTEVAGRINPSIQHDPTDAVEIERWLVQVLAAHPAMKLFFNGKRLDAPAPKPAPKSA